jgi:hypothetical protein
VGEEALALLHRLDRLETGRRIVARSLSNDAKRDSIAVPDRRIGRDLRLAWVGAGILAGILIAAVAGGYLWMVTEPLDLGAGRTVGPLLAADPLPVPTPSEIRLIRARDLLAQGKPREALAMLDAGDSDERQHASVEALRAAIQRRLLLEAGTGAAPTLPPRPDRR